MQYDEDGAEKWKEFLRWLNTPPGVTPGAPAVGSPMGPSKAAQMRAAAEAAVGREVSSLAAAVEASA